MEELPTIRATLNAFLRTLREERRLAPELVEAITKLAAEDGLRDQERYRQAIAAESERGK